MPILRFVAVVEVNLTHALRTTMILKLQYQIYISHIRSHDLKLLIVAYAGLNIQNIKNSRYHARVANLDLMHRKFIQPNRPPLPMPLPHDAKPSEFPVNEWNLLTLGKKGLCVKTSMIYRMILDKSGARRCQIWVKTPEAAQVTSLGGESRRCCCCCTNRWKFLREVAFKFLYLYDFTRDKLLLRMLEQKNEFSWYEFESKIVSLFLVLLISSKKSDEI